MRTSPSPRRFPALVPLAPAVLVVAALTLAACSTGDGDAAASSDDLPPAAEAGSPLDLAEVCPSTVVMQQDWQPQAEHGAMYALLGPDRAIDTDAKTVTGSLVAQGVDTGVDVEIRPGGPNVGFQAVSDLMYLDRDILVGAVNTDQAINAQAAGRPVVAVTSQLTSSPQIYMWDPETYPDATGVADVLATGATLVASGRIIPSLLASKGLLDMAQLDPSYEGSPQRFVTDPSIVQQGFGTSEPYTYEHEISQWMRPVAFQYLSELGYSIYPEPIVVREDDVATQAACLERLVPVLQQSQIDYLLDPELTESTNELIVELVEAYQTSWTYSPGVAAFSAAAQVSDGLAYDDPASGVFGRLDPERMTEIVDTFVPVLQSAGSLPADAQVSAERLYTNEFIDPSISSGLTAPGSGS